MVWTRDARTTFSKRIRFPGARAELIPLLRAVHGLALGFLDASAGNNRLLNFRSKSVSILDNSRGQFGIPALNAFCNYSSLAPLVALFYSGRGNGREMPASSLRPLRFARDGASRLGRILVPITRAIVLWLLCLSVAASMAYGQGAPPSGELFVEGGGSFIRNTSGPTYTNVVCPVDVIGCPPPSPITFSNAGRLFAGVRVRTGHDAVEASYSYSPNQAEGYNRLNVISFNYVRYLWLRSRVQPFATIGIGANRFSGPSPYNSSTRFGFVWNYGGGTDVALGQHLALRLELRDYVGGQPNGFIGTSHNIVPSAGIVFRFK